MDKKSTQALFEALARHCDITPWEHGWLSDLARALDGKIGNVYRALTSTWLARGLPQNRLNRLLALDIPEDIKHIGRALQTKQAAVSEEQPRYRPIPNEEETAETGLHHIFNSGDNLLVRAITANIAAFQRAAVREEQVERMAENLRKEHDKAKKFRNTICKLGKKLAKQRKEMKALRQDLANLQQTVKDLQTSHFQNITKEKAM